jgi:S-formylglutathione hydrolase FrmB
MGWPVFTLSSNLRDSRVPRLLGSLRRGLLRGFAGGFLVAVSMLSSGPAAAVPARASQGDSRLSQGDSRLEPGRVAADSGARVISAEWLNGTTFDATVESPSLADPVKIRVIVPPGWSSTATRTWPVVYAYHAGRDTYVSWTRSTDIEEVAARYDVMVVMPATGYVGWFSDWWNYGEQGTPKWETFHTKDVLQLMERNYHAGTKRAVMGISSAGYGAVKYAARNPGMFRFAASYSGMLHLTKPGFPVLVMIQSLERADPFRIWGLRGPNDRNWNANDPYVLAPRLRGTKLYISSGVTGRPGPHDHPTPGDDGVQGIEVLCGEATVSFVRRIRRLGIPATTHIYQDGWHNWEAWQPEMHRAWPLMMRAIGARRIDAR